jgi:hypothetical protein
LSGKRFVFSRADVTRCGVQSSSNEVLTVLVGVALQTLVAKMKAAAGGGGVSSQDIIRRIAAPDSLSSSSSSSSTTSSSTATTSSSSSTTSSRLAAAAVQQRNGRGMCLGEFRDVVLHMLSSNASDLACYSAAVAVVQRDLLQVSRRRRALLVRATIHFDLT